MGNEEGGQVSSDGEKKEEMEGVRDRIWKSEGGKEAVS